MVRVRYVIETHRILCLPTSFDGSLGFVKVDPSHQYSGKVGILSGLASDGLLFREAGNYVTVISVAKYCFLVSCIFYAMTLNAPESGHAMVKVIVTAQNAEAPPVFFSSNVKC